MTSLDLLFTCLLVMEFRLTRCCVLTSVTKRSNAGNTKYSRGLHLARRPQVPTSCIKGINPERMWTQPPSQSFNAHAGHCSGRHSFGHNSPAAAAREVFKPSTDSASLVVPSQKKKIIQFWVWGSLGGTSQMGVCQRSVFMAYFTRPWTPIEWAHILALIFWRN